MRVRNRIGAVALLTAAAAVAGAAAIEAAQSAEVTDPAGDVKNNTEPWQDVLRVGLAREGHTFTFSIEVAEALPEDPPEASGGLGWYLWNWGIDVDPELAPEGWPFPKTHAWPGEFLVSFVSDGEEYFAFLADRRPLAIGGEPIITVVPWRVDGAVIEVLIDAGLLDDPAEFTWSGGTVTFHAHLESEGYQFVDPLDGGGVPWPGD